MTHRPAQSRSASLLETVANVVVGYLLALAAQQLVFPLFGLVTTLAQDSAIAAIFTAVSLARSFVLRRLFEQIDAGRDADRRHAPEPASCRPAALPWVRGQGWLDAPAGSPAPPVTHTPARSRHGAATSRRAETQMPRPSHQPLPALCRQVEAMAGYGVPEIDIARVLGIDPKYEKR